MIRSLCVALGALIVMTSAQAQPATIRVACEGAALDAAVSVNGDFKGECPLDVQVKAGTIKLRATKTFGGKEEAYEQQLRLGSGTTKRIEVQFASQPATPAFAAPVIDHKAIAMQKYEAELAEWQRSVDQCRPRYADYERGLRQEMRDTSREHHAMCVRRFNNDPDFVNDCGSWDRASSEAWDRKREAKLAYENRRSETEWCERQFTKPVKPQ